MASLGNDNLNYIEAPSSFLSVDLSEKERSVLHEINQYVAAGQTLDDVMNFVFDVTVSISQCDRIGLAFLEEDGKRIVAHWARADYEPILLKKGYTEDMQGSSLQQVLDSGRPRVINNLQKYLDTHPDSRSTKLVVKEGVRSSMTCPLTIDDRIVGLFFRSSRKSNAYDDRQVAMHLMVAERLSQAVEKAYRIEQLQQVNQAYLEMLGFVSHELKNPLGSILTDTYMLNEGYFGELNDQQKSKIDRIVNKTEYITNLIREYLDLSRLESGKLNANIKNDVNFKQEILDPAVDIIKPQIESAKIKVEYEIPNPGCVLDCDPDLMKIVVVNLIGNAVKYGNNEGLIKISLLQQDKTTRFSVWNEGPGFDASQRSNLFKKFSRLQKPELMKRKGTGVGLYTCWRVVTLHGGKIDAVSEEGNWAEFYFDIPSKQSKADKEA